jgi:hypothetical protein
MVKSVEDLCKFIWSMEEKYDLLNLEVDGVKIYHYLRMEIYYDLAKKTGVLEERKLTQGKKYANFSRFMSLTWNSLRFSPIYCFKKDATVIFTHNRSVSLNGEWIDSYTHYYQQKLDPSEVVVIEKPFHGAHIRKRKANVFYSDFILVASVIAGKIYRVKEKNKLHNISELRKEIRSELDVDIELEKLFKNNIGRFKRSYKYYFRLFKRIRPKEIFYVVSYAFQADMVMAAKALQIPTTEFQHGVISRFHLGYSFPLNFKSDYLPERIFSWGSFWEDTLKEINFNVKIKTIGFDAFRSKIECYNDVQKENKSVLVLSQTALGEKIMGIVWQHRKLFEGYKVYYKLHPEEYLMYKQYPSFQQLSGLTGISFLENSDLYELMAKSERQIGVFSTALYEGLAFNCKTYILDLPGVEYMSKLINQKYAYIFNDRNWSDVSQLKLKRDDFF